jgi:hypothetical protein
VKPVEIVELPEGFDTIKLTAVWKAQVVRTEACNGQLAEIAGLGKNPE